MFGVVDTSSFWLLAGEGFLVSPKWGRTHDTPKEEEIGPQRETEDKDHLSERRVGLLRVWFVKSVLTWAVSTFLHPLKLILLGRRLEFDVKAEVDVVSVEAGDKVAGARAFVAKLMQG